MQLLNKINTRRGYTVLASLTTLTLLVIVCLIRGVPVHRSILANDCLGQYYPFTVHLWDILHNKCSLFYTWNMELGVNWLPNFAYYTSSPLLVLLLLVPRTGVRYLMEGLILFKLSFASGAMTYYLHRKHPSVSALVFGLLYGLSSFCVSYYIDIMWFDIVMLLPLLVISLEKLATQGIKRWYVLFLTVMLWSNFYLGFILCLFIPVFFIIELYHNRIPFKQSINRFVQFGVCSVLSAGVGGVLLVPTALALKQVSASQLAFQGLQVYLYAVQVLNSLLLHSQSTVIDGPPNIYTGGIVTVLCLFAVAVKHKSRQTVCYLVLSVFMLISCYFGPLGYVLHGFKYPNALPARFTFIFAFTTIVIAHEVYLTPITQWCRKVMCWILGIVVVYTFVSEFIICTLIELPRATNNVLYLIDLVCLLGYPILLFLKDNSKRLRCVLCVVVCFELVISTFISFRAFVGNAYLCPMDSSTYTAKGTQADTNKRCMLLSSPQYMYNAGLINNSGSISGFSSILPCTELHGLWGLGYSSLTSIFSPSTSIPLADSLLGVEGYRYIHNTGFAMTRYVVDTIFLAPMPVLGDCIKGIGLGTYVNPHKLSLGYVVPKDITGWNTNNYKTFEVYNDFSKSVSGQDLYTDVQMLKPVQGINVYQKQGKSTKGFFNYIVNEPYKLNRTPCVKYKCQVPSTGNIAFSIHILGTQLVDTYISTSKGVYTSNICSNGFLYIPNLDPGSTVCLTFRSTSQTSIAANEAYSRTIGLRVQSAGLDTSVYQELMNKLGESQLENIVMTDTTLDGNIDSKQDGLLMASIPNNGWDVYIDGVKTEIQPVMMGFISVPITKGKHTVHLEYHTPGLGTGIVISVLSIGLLVLWYLLDKKKCRGLTCSGVL